VIAVGAVEELHDLAVAGRFGDRDEAVAVQVEPPEFLVMHPCVRRSGEQDEQRGGFHAADRCSFRTRNP
jgi:hypothetical protein